jgi:SAM-dependent methyltransferase
MQPRLGRRIPSFVRTAALSPLHFFKRSPVESERTPKGQIKTVLDAELVSPSPAIAGPQENPKDRILAALEAVSLSGSSVLCNLGCGGRFHPNWINIDFHGDGEKVLPWNLRDGLPLPESSCDAVYASHTIEHFDPAEAKLFLLECYRVMKPNAVLRLAAPNLEEIVRTYLNCLDAARRGEAGAADKYAWIVLELLDQLVRHRSGGEMLKLWSRGEVPAEDFIIERVGTEYLRAREQCKLGVIEQEAPLDAAGIGTFRLSGEVHQWMYDSYSLGVLLSDCGFKNSKVCAADESKIEAFSNFHLDTEPDGTTYKPDSFFIEATR